MSKKISSGSHVGTSKKSQNGVMISASLLQSLYDRIVVLEKALNLAISKFYDLYNVNGQPYIDPIGGYYAEELFYFYIKDAEEELGIKKQSKDNNQFYPYHVILPQRGNAKPMRTIKTINKMFNAEKETSRELTKLVSFFGEQALIDEEEKKKGGQKNATKKREQSKSN